MAYVYIHRKGIFGDIFYVGIGKDETRGFARAYETVNRNKIWHNIFNKYGRSIEITHKDIIWEEACAIEKYLISFYGRIDLKTGCLCNLTDGGDGASGAIRTKEHIDIIKNNYNNNLKGRINTPEQLRRIAEKNKGRKISKETRQKMSIAGKNRVFSESHRRNLSISGKGKKRSLQHRINQSNALKGKLLRSDNPNARRIINTDTNQEFGCIADAAKYIGIHPATLTRKIKSGQILNYKFKN